jgi:hypothetical protein
MPHWAGYNRPNAPLDRLGEVTGTGATVTGADFEDNEMGQADAVPAPALSLGSSLQRNAPMSHRYGSSWAGHGDSI